MTAEISVSREGQDGAIAVIVLNRPSRANAYTTAMLETLLDAIETLQRDRSIRAALITGSGDRAFCGGADRGEIDTRSAEAGFSLFSRQVFDAWARVPWPTVAAINGVAVGGGLELALACDFRVAVGHARLWLPETSFGLLPAAGGLERLTHLIGPARAREMVLLGKEVDAATALAWGLVSHCGADIGSRLWRSLNKEGGAVRLPSQRRSACSTPCHRPRRSIRRSPQPRQLFTNDGPHPAGRRRPMTVDETQCPRLVAIGTAVPGRRYEQTQVADRFRITERRARQFYTNGFTHTRNLCLPDPLPDGSIPDETPLDLYNKHKHNALETGCRAIERALGAADVSLGGVSYIACATTTGYLCPSLTAHYVRALGFSSDIHRIDVVGMGCNAGLNALQPVVNYRGAAEGRTGLLVCTEICSAAYVVDDTIGTAVVNSLFGDGVAAAVIRSGPAEGRGPHILGFESLIVTDQFDAMRYDFDGSKYAFFIAREIPLILGEHAGGPVDRLLDRFNLSRSDVKHWIIHSGGRKVIDAMMATLGLTRHDVRHTDSVLAEFGNLSSGLFLFSHERLLAEEIAQSGDTIMMIIMGPGSTIECCLGVF